MKMGWIWISNLIFLLSALFQITQAQHRSPKITEHPKDVLVTKSEPTTLNCKAEGKPDPVIEWYKNGHLLDPESGEGRRIFLPFGDLFFLSVSDGRRKDFGPDSSRESDSGTYWCIARNSVGVVRSRNATLIVGVIRDEFRVVPQHTKSLVGESVKLLCSPPRGTPDPQVVWYKNSQSLDTRLGSSRMQIVDGGNLLIKDVVPNDAGRYHCSAINIAGTRNSPEVTLAVLQKAFFKVSPQDTIVLAGDYGTLSCEVDGLPPPTIDWYRQDGAMPRDRAERVSGGLRIRDIRPEDEGIYFCQTTNELGSVRASAYLTVHSRPKFLSRPRDTLVGLGRKVRFECSVAGTPLPLIYWQKLGSQSVFLPHSPSADSNVKVGSGGELTIESVGKEDGGSWICTGVSRAGAVQAVVKLSVSSEDTVPPPIIHLGPRNQTLPLKSVATLPCVPGGDPNSASVKWLKDESEIETKMEEGEKRYSISGNGTLTISDLKSSDTGLYTCIITSSSSSSSSSSASSFLSVESPTNPNIAFHRTNPSLLPLPPSTPLLNSSTQSTILLSWNWSPKAPPVRNYPLLGFSLDCWSPDEEGGRGGWKTLVRRLVGDGSRGGSERGVSYRVEGLKEGSSYYFVVRAENSEGLSPSSPLSALMRTKERGWRGNEEGEENEESLRKELARTDIQLLSSEGVSSTSIRVAWKVLKSSIKHIDGYYIRYRPLLEDESNSDESEAESSKNYENFNIVTVVAQKTEAYSHILSNLKKWTEYEIFVAPFYKNIEGQPSNLRTAITSQDKPSAPPQNLISKIINSTAASLRWSPPPRSHWNGIITGYKVEVRGNDSRLHAEMTFGPNITSIVLNNLSHGQSYLIRISSLTSPGSGPFSPPLPLSMDAQSIQRQLLLDGESQTNGTNNSEILKEVWFIILMGILLFVFLLMLLVVLYTRRRSGGKKDHISNVVVSPDSESHFPTTKQSLWLDQRWGPSESHEKSDSSRSHSKLLPHSNLVGGVEELEGVDYAEVDPTNLTTFYNNKGQIFQQLQQSDLTPYATTTLIQQRRPNYDALLPINGNPYPKSQLDNYRESDQFSSGRSKLSIGSNNFNKFKSSHPSPSPSPSSVPLKMVPMSSRLGVYPSPAPTRSHLHSTDTNYSPNSSSHANENLYHIGEIFHPPPTTHNNSHNSPNQMNNTTNCQHNSNLQLMTQNIPSSYNLYAEADDISLPPTTATNYLLNSSSGGGGGNKMTKNCSRSTSPAYSNSSDSFNSSGGSKRSFNFGRGGNSSGGKNKNNLKSLERRQLTPLLPPGRTDESTPSSYTRPSYNQNGFQKFLKFPQRDSEFLDWESGENGLKLSQGLKESNA